MFTQSVGCLTARALAPPLYWWKKPQMTENQTDMKGPPLHSENQLKKHHKLMKR